MISAKAARTEEVVDAGPVLIRAPIGQDGRRIAETLAGGGVRCRVLETLSELGGYWADDVGLVLLTEESMHERGAEGWLKGFLEGQAAWSEVPVLLLLEATRKVEKEPPPPLDGYKRTICLRRPIPRTNVVSAVEIALREREHQREIRTHLRELAKRERLAQEHWRFFQDSLDALQSHIAVLDERGTILAVNRAWREFAASNGYDGDGFGVGENYLDAATRGPQGGCRDGKAAAEGVAAVLGGRLESFELEYPCHGPEHERWFLLRVTPFRSEGPRRATVAHENITEARQNAEQLRLLLAELSHRVKNTLTTVISIAHQTLRTRGPEEFADAFFGRVQALSQAQTLLTRENWRNVSLSDLIELVVRPYRDTEGGNVELDGVEVRLSPKQAMAMSMLLHELATNAAKYGSLSIPDGNVGISWSIGAESGGEGRGRRLELVWSERDGPRVEEPARRGFGSNLIERQLSYDLGGDASIAFEPFGVVCHVWFPID